MNQILLNLSSCWKNWHVSVPAALSIACEVAGCFDTKRSDQWKLASKIIIGYTALAAANSPTPPATPPKP